MNPAELADLLQTNPRAKIAIFNLGENAGMDLAYFCHYHSLRQLFPDITLDLFRSNVDETNCIGFEKYAEYVETPLSNIRMAIVRQRYAGGQDWVQKLNAGEHIFPEEFYAIQDYDLVWGIGMGGTEAWLKQLPAKPTIGSSTVKQAVEILLARYGREADLDKAPVLDFPKITPWERTALEYQCFHKFGYPFSWKIGAEISPLATNYRDYLRISLRWPDNVRWYYSVDRQFEVVAEILRKIRAAGKPVKLIYNLKDGEVGNNFERGQSLEKLSAIRALCDDCVFTYSWTQNPYFARPTELQERAKLQSIGARNDQILKLNFWEELLMSSNAKVWLSDPGGFAEAISMLRPANKTFLFPVSQHHAGTYMTLNRHNEPIRAKINPLCFQQIYSCSPTVVEADDKGPRRVSHWIVKYGDDERQIGQDCMGDDWKFFEAAQETIFADWYRKTAPDLIDAVVKSYLGE